MISWLSAYYYYAAPHARVSSLLRCYGDDNGNVTSFLAFIDIYISAFYAVLMHGFEIGASLRYFGAGLYNENRHTSTF